MNGTPKTDQYRHGGTRTNNPSQETVATAGPGRRQPKEHRKEIRNGDGAEPVLKWRRGPERKTATAPLLMRTEQLDAQTWLQSLKKRNGVQGDFFGVFNDYETEEDLAALEWYEHAGHWSNRLIHADARRAMASLLEHEHLGGAVQMIYFDPPYEMDFDAKYANDTTARRAFADSYRRGIHSYLDAIRETMELARELLSESGSFFMQIGDVNRAGRPLDSFETILKYLRTTRTAAGLRVRAHRVKKVYKTGVKVADAQMRELRIIEDSVLLKWNYTIEPM